MTTAGLRRATALWIGIAIAAAASPAAAVATKFRPLATGAPGDERTLEVYAVSSPDQVVAKRTLEPGAPFSLDLEPGRYGARLEGGPTLATFSAGDTVALDLGPWLVPSLAFGVGVAGLWVDAEVNSTLGLQQDHEERIVHTDYFVDAELAGPPIRLVPCAPRPFLRISGHLPSGANESIVAASQPFGPNVRLSQELEGSWTVGLGATFTIPGAFEFQVKPSIHYVNERLELKARMDDNPALPISFFQERQRVSSHGVAPALSLEKQVIRTGNLGVNLFAEGMLRIFPGDRSESIRVEGGGNAADFEWEREITSFSAGGGLRFAWLGCGLCGGD